MLEKLELKLAYIEKKNHLIIENHTKNVDKIVNLKPFLT